MGSVSLLTKNSAKAVTEMLKGSNLLILHHSISLRCHQTTSPFYQPGINIAGGKVYVPNA